MSTDIGVHLNDDLARRLNDLVNEPREALDMEVKSWLDLTDLNQRGNLAKAIIALANHGGGYIVIGFEQQPDGSFCAAQGRPENLVAWSQDAIHAIVEKYVEPTLQCRMDHIPAAASGKSHPVISVPGGHRVPLRAKTGSPDGKKLVANRVYIRRSGPKSEEPRSADEWDTLFDRCLKNRKDDLLNALRSIMAGEVPSVKPATPTRTDQLLAFEHQAIARWEALIEALPANAPARFSHGYGQIGFAIDGEFERRSLSELRQIIQSAVRNHSGWPPFIIIDRPPHSPKPINDSVECWIRPENDRGWGPSNHDFWRASPVGLLFTRRGYREDDHLKGIEPGRYFDVNIPVWRFGEAVLQASYIAQRLNAHEANLICHAKWTGLSGRTLIRLQDNYGPIPPERVAAQDEYEMIETVPTSALPDALPEFVFKALQPMYQLFDFFDLPKRAVEQELRDLQSKQY